MQARATFVLGLELIRITMRLSPLSSVLCRSPLLYIKCCA